MKKFLVVFIVTIVLYYIFDALLTKSITNNEYRTVLFFFVFLFPFYLFRFLSHKDAQYNTNFGLYFFLVMSLIFIIGNLNYYIVHYIYPKYRINFVNLNKYWMVGMALFSEGYFSIKINYKHSDSFLLLNKYIAFFFFTISICATLLIVLSIGNIPFFTEGKGSGEDFVSGTMLTRLWALNLFSAIMFLLLFFKSKKKVYLLMIIVNLFCSVIFNQRMLPFAIIVSIIIVTLFIITNKRMIVLVLIIGSFAYMLSNFLFLSNRNDIQENNKKLSFVQNSFIRSTFNEYQQLGRLIESDIPIQRGKTFLSIPLSFVPAPFLSPLGIVKSDYMNNNSATLLAKYENSRTSIGLRTGLLGELFVNFSYWGIIMMFFLGQLVSYLRNQYIRLPDTDFRVVIIIAVYVLLLYSLIGQINAVTSQIANYLIIAFLFILFWRAYFPVVKNRV